ncbi:MAG: phage tail tape measure protein [Hyphomicrobiaceae bacterium]
MDDEFGFEEAATISIRADTTEYRKGLLEASSIGRQFGRSLTRAFDGIAFKGRGLGDVFRSLALDLSKLVLKSAFKPVEQGLGGLLSGLFSGGVGFAKGAALQQGTPIPFAKGGVISSPVTFPLGGGGVGLAGEAGAEAIMPLRRGADGRLGVAASGGSNVTVTMNISSPDVDGFQRSQTQVAAQLARAVSLGQRNL